jgi:uncharacterized protein (DUF58 family)
MITPAPRLLVAVALWAVSSVLAVAFSALQPVALVAAAALAVLALWDLALLNRRAPLGASRVLPARAFIGRPMKVRLRIVNDGPAVICDLIDEPPADRIGEDPYQRGVSVEAGAVYESEYELVPRRRGDRVFGDAVLLVHSPLGLLRRRQTFGDGDLLRVYPDASHYLRPEALASARVLEAIGVKPAPRRGEGLDFESLREYLPGDDPRRVDWLATARRGRLVVRQFQHERNHTVVIAVDASRLMAGEVEGRSKLDHAVDAALALAYAALTAGDRVSLLVFDREVFGHLAPRAHRRQLGDFLELLRPVQPRLVEASYDALARALALRHRQRALVVVLTDFVEANSARVIAPLSVVARRHRLVLVALRDRLFGALDLPATGDDLDIYRRLVLDDLLRERDTALSTLRRSGVQTVDLSPELITAAVLNRYLAIRYGPDR